jgi:hypothetical protein
LRFLCPSQRKIVTVNFRRIKEKTYVSQPESPREKMAFQTIFLFFLLSNPQFDPRTKMTNELQHSTCFQEAIQAAACQKAVRYRDSYSVSIRWEGDRQGAEDVEQFQSILSFFYLTDADELVLTAKNFTFHLALSSRRSVVKSS